MAVELQSRDARGAPADATPSDAAPALAFRKAVKHYQSRRNGRREALTGCSLSIITGESVALLGANGSGKSTLLRIAAGIESLTAGEAWLLGAPVLRRLGAGSARRLGVVFQTPSLDPLLTVTENLALGASLFGVPRDSGAVGRWIERMGLADRAHDRVVRLSGGLARRCDLARALLPEPDLLLLDEATVGLDHESRGLFWDAIDIWRSEHKDRTLVFSTHLADEAERADRVIMIAGGAVAADDSPDALRARAGARSIQLDEPADAKARRIMDSVVRDGESLDRAASDLVRIGAPFHFASPGLGEAYALITGRSLREQSQESHPAGSEPAKSGQNTSQQEGSDAE